MPSKTPGGYNVVRAAKAHRQAQLDKARKNRERRAAAVLLRFLVFR